MKYIAGCVVARVAGGGPGAVLGGDDRKGAVTAIARMSNARPAKTMRLILSPRVAPSDSPSGGTSPVYRVRQPVLSHRLRWGRCAVVKPSRGIPRRSTFLTFDPGKPRRHGVRRGR